MRSVRVELPDPDWYLDHVVLPRAEPGPAAGWPDLWRRAYRQLAATPVERRARDQGFVIGRDEARRCGVADPEVRRRVRRGQWWQPARGTLALVPVPEPAGADLTARAEAERQRHALRAAAEALLRPGQVISGRSAAVLHGLPLFTQPGAVEVTAALPTTQGNRAPALVRCARLGEDQRTEWFGVPVTSVPRTLIDLARHHRRDGIVAADAALRERRTDRASLARVAADCAGWPGVRAAREIVALADPLAESPLESITRLAVHDEGLPPPRLQVVIPGPQRYRVDMLWPEQRVALEADGRVKYSDRELWAEKRRQERLERLGYRVLRVLWADVVGNWPETAARIRHALAAHRG